MKIIKRSGKEVLFDKAKIEAAVSKANISRDGIRTAERNRNSKNRCGN